MSEQTSEAKDRIVLWVQYIQDAKTNKSLADGRADLQSLDRAADLEILYQDMSWMSEMPALTRKRLGRRIDLKSRDQFAKWVKQTFGWGSQARLAQLRAAHELLPILITAVNEMHPSGEGSLRPLAKLRAEGYGDHQADVWADAVKLAGDRPPTQTEVRRAVILFLERHKPPVRNLAADPRAADERRTARRNQFITEFDSILVEDNRAAKEMLNQLIRHYNEHQSHLREERSA